MTESADLAADLNAALQEISRTTVLSCEYAVPENPDGGGVDLDKVNVTFTPGGGAPKESSKTIARDCDAVDGWQYSAGLREDRALRRGLRSRAGRPRGSRDIELGCPTVVR